MTHDEYRNTEYWYNLRHKLFDMRGGRCEKCHKKLYGENYDIHHKDEKYRAFDEDLEKLELLCRDCHNTYHCKDFLIPDGIHDFKVVEVKEKQSAQGKDGHNVTIEVVRKADMRECKCWVWLESGSWREQLFRKSIGLPDCVEIDRAIYSTGRALFKNDGEYNGVDRFFTKVETVECPF